MSKKGAEDKDRVVLFGRASNNVTMGIVGLANVGKSTFFNVLTHSQVAAENYPFCTIGLSPSAFIWYVLLILLFSFQTEPSTARTPVPDERWEHLCKVFKPKKEIPAFLSVTDIAGLIKGASENKGLGNQFLSNIYAVDGIYHVVRIFEDEDITHVEGSIDPCRDLDIVCTELRLKDIEILTSKVDGLQRIVGRTNDKEKKFELVCFIKYYFCILIFIFYAFIPSFYFMYFLTFAFFSLISSLSSFLYFPPSLLFPILNYRLLCKSALTCSILALISALANGSPQKLKSSTHLVSSQPSHK